VTVHDADLPARDGLAERRDCRVLDGERILERCGLAGCRQLIEQSTGTPRVNK
jgi:hypothetical protein